MTISSFSNNNIGVYTIEYKLLVIIKCQDLSHFQNFADLCIVEQQGTSGGTIASSCARTT